jgi:hypothetical protein
MVYGTSFQFLVLLLFLFLFLVVVLTLALAHPFSLRTKSQYKVFQKVAEHATEAINYFTKHHPDLCLRNLLVLLHLFPILFPLLWPHPLLP